MEFEYLNLFFASLSRATCCCLFRESLRTKSSLSVWHEFRLMPELFKEQIDIHDKELNEFAKVLL